MHFHRNDSRNKIAEHYKEVNVHFEYPSHWDREESIFCSSQNITTLRRSFKKKITTKGGKGQYEQAKAKEEETRKINEDARRLAQEAEGWLKGEEVEKRRVAQEVARKAEEAAKIEKEERKRKLDEEMKKQGAEKINLTQTVTEQSASDAADS